MSRSMAWSRGRTISLRELQGVGQAAPDPSSRHLAPGGDSYDPWGSAHGEEDRCGRDFHGRCSDEFREWCAFYSGFVVNIVPAAVSGKSDFCSVLQEAHDHDIFSRRSNFGLFGVAVGACVL